MTEKSCPEYSSVRQERDPQLSSSPVKPVTRSVAATAAQRAGAPKGANQALLLDSRLCKSIHLQKYCGVQYGI